MKAQLKKVIVEIIQDDKLIKSTEVAKTAKGKIISKGPTCEIEANEGDIILFSGYAGAPFDHNGNTYSVLNQEEVFAKL